MAKIDKATAALVAEDPPARPLGQFGVESFKFAGQIRGTNWVSVTEKADSWSIICNIVKVRPGETHLTVPIYVGATEEVTLEVPVTVYGDNLPKPLQQEFRIHVRILQSYFSKTHDKLPEKEDE